jgi:acetyl-CoA carboxylase carboxyltransferase component
MDVRYAAARGWVDAIIDPRKTRDVLTTALAVSTNYADERPFQLGVFQT